MEPAITPFSHARIKPHGTERVHWATFSKTSGGAITTTCGMKMNSHRVDVVREDVNCPRCLTMRARLDPGAASKTAGPGDGYQAPVTTREIAVAINYEPSTDLITITGEVLAWGPKHRAVEESREPVLGWGPYTHRVTLADSPSTMLAPRYWLVGPVGPAPERDTPPPQGEFEDLTALCQVVGSDTANEVEIRPVDADADVFVRMTITADAYERMGCPAELYVKIGNNHV